jgi:uncharacterized protein
VTALDLLAMISAALLLQLALGVGVAVWRWQRRGLTPAPPESAAGSSAWTLAWQGFRPFRVLRRQFEDALQTQCSFYLAPSDGLPLPPFRPGQFLTIAFDIPVPSGGAGHTLTRCYSMSDAPRPDCYRLTVKRVPSPPDRPTLPPGVVSNHLHDRVQEGDLLQVKAPSGRFCIDADSEVPAVLIAGGIGITPLLSMLIWSLGKQPGRSLHLYYGVRHGGERVFRQLLDTLAVQHPSFHQTVTFSQPRPEDICGRDFQHAGHIDETLLRQTLPAGRYLFYVCGPPPMMASLIPALLAWGIPAEDIHHEAFGPASLASVPALSVDPTLSSKASVEIQFRRSGRTLIWDGRDSNLLDFAERQGIAVESGCRSGSCGSCETALVSGSVRYPVKPDYDPGAGRCLLCVGVPGSNLVLNA